MNLPVPIVGVEAGPQYAVDVNSCFSILDQHNHTPGSGVLITPSAININANLPLNGNRLTTVLSVVFSAQGSPLPGSSPDLGALYVAGDDLYYNDEAGNQVRITQNGGVVGTPGSITGLVPPASASYVSANSTFVWQSDANTPANMDMASIILRNLVANSFGLTINPPPAMAADYSITMPVLPVTNSFMAIDEFGNETATIPISKGLTASNIEDGSLTPQLFQQGFGPIASGFILSTGSNILPAGYLFCNGATNTVSSFQQLWLAIGNAYGSSDGGITTGTVTGGTNSITVANPAGFVIGKYIRTVDGGNSIFPVGTTITNVVVNVITTSANALNSATAAETHAATNFNVPDLRGEFLRGTDLGAGRDPNTGARTASNTGGNTADNVGSVQGSDFLSHQHRETVTDAASNSPGVARSDDSSVGGFVNSVQFTNFTGGSETRPINVYVNYIIKT